MRYLKDSTGNNSNRNLIPFSAMIKSSDFEPSIFLKRERSKELDPSNHLKRERSKSNLKPLNEVEIQKVVNDRLNAKVYERGETIDVNEGMHHKVKTFFMLQYDGESVFDGKEKKREYINKYAKMITDNIDDNIKGINLKLAMLNKEKKSKSLHDSLISQLFVETLSLLHQFLDF